MWIVAACLLPVLLLSVVVFGVQTLLITAVSVISCVVVEALSQKGMKRRITISDGSAVVTGMLLAFVIPPGVPLWLPHPWCGDGDLYRQTSSGWNWLQHLQPGDVGAGLFNGHLPGGNDDSLAAPLRMEQYSPFSADLWMGSRRQHHSISSRTVGWRQLSMSLASRVIFTPPFSLAGVREALGRHQVF